EAFAPAPVSVQRTVVSEPRPVRLGENGLEGRLVVLGSASLTPEDPTVDERVEAVADAWPSAGAEPVQGMLHAGPAEDRGLGAWAAAPPPARPPRCTGRARRSRVPRAAPGPGRSRACRTPGRQGTGACRSGTPPTSAAPTSR